MPKGSSESETNGGKDPASLRDGYRTTFEQNLTYSVPDDEKKDFVPVTLEVASTEYKSYMHAVHGMIYCFGECILWDRYKQSGQILVSESWMILHFKQDGSKFSVIVKNC